MSSTRDIYVVLSDGEVAGSYKFVALFLTQEDAFAFAEYKQLKTKEIYSYAKRTVSEEKYKTLMSQFPFGVNW
jgi:hypothetical protein